MNNSIQYVILKSKTSTDRRRPS